MSDVTYKGFDDVMQDHINKLEVRRLELEEWLGRVKESHGDVTIQGQINLNKRELSDLNDALIYFNRRLSKG